MNPLKQSILFILFLFPLFLTAQNDTCNYKIQLIDFFGDGWDGAELSVVIQGDTSNYTLLDSTMRFVDIQAIQNERIQIFFSTGAFDEEISYIVFDPAGEIIFNDGPFPDTGLVVDIIACPSCPIPTQLTINTTDKTAFVQWDFTQNDALYLIEYGEKGFLLGNGSTRSTYDTSIIIPNLLPFTEYDIYLSAICFSNNATLDTSLTNLQSSFTTRFAKDVGIESIGMPNSGCGLSNAEMINITLKNYGANPQSLIPFRFSVNGMDGGVMIPSDGFYTNVLSKDSIAFIEFETTYDFSPSGTYEIAVWTELEGDGQLANDTTYLQVQSIPTITELPYSQHFEMGNNDWSTDSESSEVNWKIGQPNSEQLMPFYSGANSWFLEIEEPNELSNPTYLYSPCLDFSSYAEDIKIAFQLLMNTDDANSKCWLEMSTDEGMNWQSIDTSNLAINWYNNSAATAWANTSNWQYVETTLPNSAQEANVRLRIVFEHGGAETNGQKVAIDDVQLFAPIGTNLVVLSTQNTASEGCGVIADQVQLQLYNTGQTELVDIDVHYQINEGVIISEILDTLILESGEQATYQFQTPFNTITPNEYMIKTWATVAGDVLPISDTAYYQFTVDSPLSLPFVEDFEDQVVDEGWFAVGNAEVAIRPPGDHNNESNIMAVNLWTGATRTAIHTANYGIIAEGDSLSLDYRFVLWDDSTFPLTLAGDSLMIAISTDCGTTFEQLLVIEETNHLPSAEFQTIKLDLSPYAGQNAVFRFSALWAQNDYWLDIDNISILPNEQTTSITDIPTFISNFNLFPNPSSGVVQVELSLLEKEAMKLQVLNSTGQFVFQQAYAKNDYFAETIDLSGFPNGVYFVKINTSQQTASRKLIKVD